MTSKVDTLRKRVYAFHEKHCDKPKTFTVNHFAAEGVPRSTLFGILKREVNETASKRQGGRGRPAKIMTKSGIKRTKCIFGLLYRIGFGYLIIYILKS